jgi:hypothetical protein
VGSGAICDGCRFAILLDFGRFDGVIFITVFELSGIVFWGGSEEKADILFCCGSKEKVRVRPAVKRENQDSSKSAPGGGTWSTDDAGLTGASDASKNQHRR